MKLHCEISGNGEPLVMLHGIFGSLSNLGAIARLLEPDFQLYRVDLRNHGRSPHSDSMSFADMAADLLQLLDDNGLERAHLFGHSLGGKVCMSLATRHPGRVDKLVVGDIAPLTYPPHHSDILEGLLSVDLQNCTGRNDADVQLARCVKEKGVRQFLLKNLLRDEAGRYYWQLNLAAIAAHYDELRGAVGDGLVYEGETLFIRGGESSYIRDQDLPRIYEKFPNATIETIEGTGHWLHAEQPQRFAQLMLDFLRTG